MENLYDDPHNAAERILKLADRELGSVPEAMQEETLREVLRDMRTWLEAIEAGKEWEQKQRGR